MADVTLLPCPNPWCTGAPNVIRVGGNGMRQSFVRCGACGITPPGMAETEELAIAAWNTRPAPALTNRDEAGHGLKQELMAARDRLTHLPPLDLSRLYESPDAAAALTPKQAAADEMFEALENCAELLNVAMERLGVCGEGDSGQRRADAEFPGGVAALHAARAALAKAGQP